MVTPSKPEKSSWMTIMTRLRPRSRRERRDGFPTLEVFAAMFYETAQDFLSAVAVKAGDEVDASRPQTFVFFDFDVLTIEEDGEHVGVDGS